MDNKSISDSLEQLNLVNKNHNHILVWLKKNHTLYNSLKICVNNNCKICDVLKQINLPYDCLQNPGYCTRKPLYFEYINIYETTEEKIKAIQN